MAPFNKGFAFAGNAQRRRARRSSHPLLQPPKRALQADSSEVIQCCTGLASLITTVEPTVVPMLRQSPKGFKTHQVACFLTGAVQPSIDARGATEDTLIPACVHHVVPHAGGGHQEVHHLIPGRWPVLTDDPRVGRAASQTAGGHEHFVVAHEVWQGKRVPGTPSPPQRRRAHHRETERHG